MPACARRSKTFQQGQPWREKCHPFRQSDVPLLAAIRFQEWTAEVTIEPTSGSQESCVSTYQTYFLPTETSISLFPLI